jgi:hypothetical protein
LERKIAKIDLDLFLPSLNVPSVFFYFCLFHFL